jgi:hypothetical protein
MNTISCHADHTNRELGRLETNARRKLSHAGGCLGPHVSSTSSPQSSRLIRARLFLLGAVGHVSHSPRTTHRPSIDTCRHEPHLDGHASCK